MHALRQQAPLTGMLAASLLLHGVAVALAPHHAAFTLPQSPPIEIIPFTPQPAAPPPAPVITPTAPRPAQRRVAPAAAPKATVEDRDGELTAPTRPTPPLTFKLPFAEKLEPQQPAVATASATGDVVETPPSLSAEIKPPYPDEARWAGVDGEVVLRVTIAADGTVEAVHVESTPGHGLEQAAMGAVRRARFTPATRNGQPIRSVIKYRYVFRLD